MKAISIGEALWDVFPGEERLGGAPLNFAAHLARLGHSVSLVSGVGDDDRGKRVLERMSDLGVGSRFVAVVPGQPTGAVQVALDRGEPSYRILRPAAYDFPALPPEALAELRRFSPHWIYFGTLAQTSAPMREVTRSIVAALPAARRLYDVNLRPESYSLPLVAELLSDAHAVKINLDEARLLASQFGFAAEPMQTFCDALACRFGCEIVCVTRGGAGCAIRTASGYAEVPGRKIQLRDAVGAGDAFAAALMHGLDSGWPLARTGDFANRVGALVASLAGAIPNWTVADAEALR